MLKALRGRRGGGAGSSQAGGPAATDLSNVKQDICGEFYQLKDYRLRVLHDDLMRDYKAVCCQLDAAFPPAVWHKMVRIPDEKLNVPLGGALDVFKEKLRPRKPLRLGGSSDGASSTSTGDGGGGSSTIFGQQLLSACEKLLIENTGGDRVRLMKELWSLQQKARAASDVARVCTFLLGYLTLASASKVATSTADDLAHHGTTAQAAAERPRLMAAALKMDEALLGGVGQAKSVLLDATNVHVRMSTSRQLDAGVAAAVTAVADAANDKECVAAFGEHAEALQSFALRVYDKELGPSLKQLRDAYVDGEFEVMDPMFQQVVMQKAWATGVHERVTVLAVKHGSPKFVAGLQNLISQRNTIVRAVLLEFQKDYYELRRLTEAYGGGPPLKSSDLLLCSLPALAKKLAREMKETIVSSNRETQQQIRETQQQIRDAVAEIKAANADAHAKNAAALRSAVDLLLAGLSAMLEGHLPPHLQQIVEASLRGIQELAAAGAAAPEDEGEEAEQAAAEAMEAAAAPAAALAEVAAAAVAGVSTPEASEVQHSSQVEAVLTGSDLDEQASLLFWQLALR